MRPIHPLVSIIVRTKDRPRLLREALASLSAQIYAPLEVIVVNDGGGDVASVVGPFRRRFHQLRLVQFQHNRGRSAAANAGLLLATGEYLGFLDDDDWLAPEHIFLLVSAFGKSRSLALYSGVSCVQRVGTRWREVYRYSEPYDLQKLRQRNFIPIHAVLFHRSLVEQGCRFDETFDLYEDWDFWLQVSEKTTFQYTGVVTAFYRMTNQGNFGFCPDEKKRLASLKRLYHKWGAFWTEEIWSDLLLAREHVLAEHQEQLRGIRATLEASQRYIRHLERALQASRRHIAELERTRRLDRHHLHNLEQALESSRHHIRNLERLLLQRSASRWLRRRLHRPELLPLQQIVADKGKYRSLGGDPRFKLQFHRGEPSGWIVVELRGRNLQPALYYETGLGLNENQRLNIPQVAPGQFQALVRLPEHVLALYLDPCERTGTFTVESLSILELGKIEAALRLLAPSLKDLLAHPHRLPALLKRIYRIYRAQGLRGVKLHIARRAAPALETPSYETWFERFGRLSDEDRRRIRRHIRTFSRTPTFSILMPVYNPKESWLRAALDSVLRQLYPHWELCVVDDASDQPHVRRVLEEYRRRDPRIQVHHRRERGNISAALNDALAMATGEYVTFLDHDDELAEHALYLVAHELNQHPQAVLLYSDEDKIDEEGHHFDPYFKPDFDPLLLLGQNVLNHLTVYRADVVRQVGGFRRGVEGCQDWDLALRVTATLTEREIRHLPYVLYHWRAVEGSTARHPTEKQGLAQIAAQVVSENLERRGLAADVQPLPHGHCQIHFRLPKKPPKVTIIVPTRDGYPWLRRCLDGLVERTRYPDYEVLVVDNGSTEPETRHYLRRLPSPRFRVLRYEVPFNFSAINNFAARQATGEVLLFLNDDTEIVGETWLQEMVALAVQPDVGAVGAMLYYPDRTIQHAGVILGVGGVAGHAYLGFPRGSSGQMGRLLLVQSFAAVTAACLAVRKRVFEEVGGFDERLAVAFNDVDLCLRIRERGYRNVWTPFAELIHHESKSRGYEDTPEKQARFQRETEFMLKRWGKLLELDPTYNPNLTLRRADFSLAEEPRVNRPWEERATVFWS